jgi:hypothetical protein
MKASKTHFEQIPVATVKQIAQALPNGLEIDDVTIKSQDGVPPRQERWREIAKKAELQSDPEKLIELVEELIAAFDEEEDRKSGKGLFVVDGSLSPAAVSNPHDPPFTVGQLGSEKTPDLRE